MELIESASDSPASSEGGTEAEHPIVDTTRIVPQDVDSVNRENAENSQDGSDQVPKSRKPKAKKPANEHAFDDAVRRMEERDASSDGKTADGDVSSAEKTADDAVTRTNEEKVQGGEGEEARQGEPSEETPKEKTKKTKKKKKTDKPASLYVAISLHPIKMTEVWKQGTTENGVAQSSRSVTISIADLFAKINPKDAKILKYIPDGFLNQEQLDAKFRELNMREPQKETAKGNEDKSLGKGVCAVLILLARCFITHSHRFLHRFLPQNSV